MSTMVQFLHVNTVSTGQVAGAHTQLMAVNVNTGAASAVLTLYNGTSTSAPVVAVINCAAVVCFQYEGCRCPAGLFYGLAGGTADVTISYT